MARIVLLTGGARSGKSRLAQERLARFQRVVFIATAQGLDEEMRRRIALHQQKRPESWITIEEPLELARAIERAGELKADAVLLDCLTLWLSNRMLREWPAGWSDQKEAVILEKLQGALNRAALLPAKEFVVISNELGSGIVPENEMARAFRDLAGRANQAVAAAAAEVQLVVAGLALKMK